MNPSASHDDLDLIDISNWNTSDHFSFGHNADDSSAFNLSASASNDQQNYYDMNGGDDGTINTVRSTSGNNILGLRKSANPPTISSIYEPKFLEIFNSYSKFASSYEPNLDLSNPASQHLMTLCLNNVLPFSNWARETTTSSYIRATLFENPDMRPEVRNGLALIIVYTFSAAKAADEAEIALNSKPTPNASGGRGTKDTIDMFSVLMKQETGMGIVNKTSLKMYSDPLGFFNFIKSCISGLIDAAGIPENERQNIQQSKKTRRGSRNKDEVEAFHYLKSSLVAMFQLPETVQLAKDKINQINQFWRLKGNTIRNERFSCVFQLPTPTQSARNSGIREPSLSNGALSLGMRENSQSDETNSTRNNSAINSGINSAMNSANTSGVGPNAFPGMAAAQLQYAQQQAAATALALQQQLQCVSTRTSGRSDISLTVDTSAIPPRSQRLSNNSETFNIYDNNDNDSVSTSSRSPHPGYDAQQAQQAMYNNAGYYPPPAPHMGSHDNSPVLSHHQYTASGQKIYPAINAITVSGAGISSSPMAPHTPPAPAVPVPSIRYDRVGSSKWVANSTLLYDLDSLQNSLSTQSCGTYYLVDESKLKSFLDEAAAQSGGAPVDSSSNSNSFSDIVLSNYMLSSGINSLEKVLHKSGSLATSWNRFDFSQFRVFVDSWKALQQPGTSEGGAGRSRTNSVDSTASRNIFNTGAPPMIADPSVKRPVRRRTTGAIDIRRDMARLSELQEQENMSRLGIDAMHIDNPSPRTEEGGIHPQMFSYGSLPGAQNTGDSNMTAVPNNNGLSNLFGNVPAPAAPSPQPYSGRSSPKTTHANFFGPSNPSLQVPTSPHSSQRGRSASVPALPPSLLEYWQSLTNGNSPGGLFRTPSCGILELAKGKGVIVYERSLEVGLIIRANPNYNIMEDAWCLYYPEDVQYTAPSVPFGHPQPPPDINTSFAALLVHLLPQLRNLMRLIQPAPGLQPGMPQQNQNQQGMQYGQQYPSAGYQQQMQMQQQQQHYGTASMHGNPVPPPFDNESPNSIMPPSGNTAGRMGARKSNTFSFSTGGGNDNSLLQFQQQMAAQQAQQQQQQQVSGFGAPKSGGFGSRTFQDAPQQNVITVSYYSHKMDHNSAFTATNLAIHNNNSGSNGFHGPPAAPSSGNFYRTVGTLDSQFHMITSKFQEDSYFHDIILR